MKGTKSQSLIDPIHTHLHKRRLLTLNVLAQDVSGGPGLSLFMWEDGSDFEFLMNHENLLEFPPGMSRDPNVGPSLFSNTTFMKGLQAAKHSLAQGVSALYL